MANNATNGRMAPRTVSAPLLAARNAFQPALSPPRNPLVSSGTTTLAAVTRVTLTVDMVTFLSSAFSCA
jgi:hypothetical protein